MSEQGHANAGYQRLFDTDGLSIGIGFSLTGVRESTPVVEDEFRLAEHAEAIAFDAIWVRDVPTYWPRFGDAGDGAGTVAGIRGCPRTTGEY